MGALRAAVAALRGRLERHRARGAVVLAVGVRHQAGVSGWRREAAQHAWYGEDGVLRVLAMRRHRLPSVFLALLGALAGTLAIAACGGSSSPGSTTSSSTTTSTHTTSTHTTSTHTTSTHTTSTHHKFHSGGKSGY